MSRGASANRRSEGQENRRPVVTIRIDESKAKNPNPSPKSKTLNLLIF
jgi:hypothetical protein